MPDTYLREAQMMVLDAQEQVLRYIRAGGSVATLKGLPLRPGVTLGPEESGSKEYQDALEDIDKVSKASSRPMGRFCLTTESPVSSRRIFANPSRPIAVIDQEGLRFSHGADQARECVRVWSSTLQCGRV